MKYALVSFSLFCTAAVVACDNSEDPALSDTENNQEAPIVGFEILEVVSPNELRAWAAPAMTEAEFDALELPTGWIKNQPREVDMDQGLFLRSPDSTVDGPLTEQTFFGFAWRHVATIIDTDVLLDEEGRLRGSSVSKFHRLTFHAGRTLTIIVSPEGEQYVRVSRDFGRTVNEPSIPASWQKTDYVTPDELVIQLPTPALVIRTDNEDSFQGPIPKLDL